MLHRFDTLLARIVMLVIMAVLSTFILVFVIVQFQMSSRDDLPGRAMRVAQSALSELQVQGWPQSLPVEELKRLKVDDYFVGDHPIARPGSSYREEELRAHLGLADSVAVGVRFFGPRMGRPGEFRELTEFGPPEDGSRPAGPPDADASPQPQRDFGLGQRIMVSIEVSEGTWINLRTTPIKLEGPGPGLLPVAVLVVLMIGIGVWAAMNAINPLRQMAKAANTLASDYTHQPLDEQGPYDVRESLRAFNRMGRRLESTVAGQRQLLAAIGHDLRTPITSLKLKVEMLADANERERMRRALFELERITEAALAAATAGQSGKPFQPLDLFSLVDSLVEDLADLGLAVSFVETDHRPIVMGRSDELTRSLRNLIENAVRYGERASVELSERQGMATIQVRDSGPGIPVDAIDRVFEPLVRLEESRNRKTGGHGLGLHIAKTLVEAHGGRISLENLEEGGLLATIALPLKADA